MTTPGSTRRPTLAATVDLNLLTIRHGRLCVLLVRRAEPPDSAKWALPGRFLEADEDPDDGAVREVFEDTGVDVRRSTEGGHVEQLRTYGAPFRDPRLRVLSVAYLAFLPISVDPVAGSDAVHFWAVDDLNLDGTDDTGDAPDLAFDHARIISDAVERCRSKLEYTTLAASFLDEPFTLGDLRRVYEAVWDVGLHAPNFARKVTSIPGFVVPVEGSPDGRGRRPLYQRGPAATMMPPMMRPDRPDSDEPGTPVGPGGAAAPLASVGPSPRASMGGAAAR